MMGRKRDPNPAAVIIALLITFGVGIGLLSI